MHGSAIRTPGATGRVGSYGCSFEGRARIVRAAFVGSDKPPTSAEVDCPVCGERHRVGIAWRRPEKLDEGREPDLVLDDDGEVSS